MRILLRFYPKCARLGDGCGLLRIFYHAKMIRVNRVETTVKDTLYNLAEQELATDLDSYETLQQRELTNCFAN